MRSRSQLRPERWHGNKGHTVHQVCRAQYDVPVIFFERRMFKPIFERPCHESKQKLLWVVFDVLPPLARLYRRVRSSSAIQSSICSQLNSRLTYTGLSFAVPAPGLFSTNTCCAAAGGAKVSNVVISAASAVWREMGDFFMRLLLVA